ncbi:MAG: ABC transporter ATP-binding protein [Candidatus Heimdallarchaeota archaeon]|nr:ABC transporter ATP-binding protein [Candidatus Heimdallarchaeota archaeon]
MKNIYNRTDKCVRLKNVSKVYDMGLVQVNAIENASLDVPKGQFIVILGPSGSGKTTLLNLIGAIDVPSNGDVHILENDLTQSDRKQLAKVRRDSIGFIFQFFNLLPSLTALENVEYALQLKNVANSRQKAKQVLERVGLQDRADHFPSELSGGEQQRVAIARAIAKSPEIILADEPTGELDSETGIKILELLIEIAKNEETTIIMVTHSSEIAKIADRVIRLRSGKIVSDELNPQPLHPNKLGW